MLLFLGLMMMLVLADGIERCGLFFIFIFLEKQEKAGRAVACMQSSRFRVN